MNTALGFEGTFDEQFIARKDFASAGREKTRIRSHWQSFLPAAPRLEDPSSKRMGSVAYPKISANKLAAKRGR
jgi:hypothetical protein